MRTTPMSLTLLLAVFTATAVASAPPAQTVILFEVDDLGAALGSFEGSSAQRAYREIPALGEAVDGILGRLGKVLRTHVENARNGLGLSNGQRDTLIAWPKLVKGRITLAIVAAGTEKELKPLLRYEAKTTSEADATRAVLRILDDAYTRLVPGNPIKVEDGVSVLRDEFGAPQIAFVMKERELLVSQSPDLVHQALAAEGRGRWEATMDRAVAATGGGSGLRAWVDVAGLSRLGEEAGLDQGARDLLRLLDALGIRSAAWSSVFTKDGGKDALHLSTGKDSIITRFTRDSAPAPWPGTAPAGTLLSISVGASPQDLLSLWLEVAEATDVAAFANAQKGLDELFFGLGVDAHEDLLGPMGPGIVLHLVSCRGELKPLATAPVRDHQRLLESGDLIATAAEWRRTRRDDGVLWVNPEDQTGFLLRKDRFWVGHVSALATLTEKPAAVPGLAAVRGRVPAEARAVAVASHVTLAAALRKPLARAFPALAKLLAKDGPLARRLGAEAMSLTTGEHGVTIRHESTAAPAGIWLIAAGIRGVMAGN